jgi:hypothetical protein
VKIIAAVRRHREKPPNGAHHLHGPHRWEGIVPRVSSACLFGFSFPHLSSRSKLDRRQTRYDVHTTLITQNLTSTYIRPVTRCVPRTTSSLQVHSVPWLPRTFRNRNNVVARTSVFFFFSNPSDLNKVLFVRITITLNR